MYGVTNLEDRYGSNMELRVDSSEAPSDRGDGEAGDDGYSMVDEVDDANNNGTGVLLSSTSPASRNREGSCAT